jgi:putative chitinase
MDRAAFFAAVRPMFGKLTPSQVSGMEAILDTATDRQTPLQFLAYMLATARHETAHTMQPIEEYGKGHGRKYGAPAGPYGHVYYGRGFVQLTWLSNYEKAEAELGIPLVKRPELALELKPASAIMFEGMEHGWFTGKKLSDYIGQHGADYKNARRIINGVDKSEAIAGYARSFERALKLAGY